MAVYPLKIDKVQYAYRDHYGDKRKEKIDRIIIHHAAAPGWTMQTLLDFMSSGKRQVSATFAIGNDGKIGLAVPETNKPWTTSGYHDEYAITVEIANSKGEPNWEISDAALNKLIELVAYTCTKYGFEPKFTGDKSGTIHYHAMYEATACPGPYLKSKMKYIEQEAKKLIATMNNASAPTSKPEAVTQLEYTALFGHLNHVYAKVGDKVKKGTRLAELGSTGGSSGPHLHYGALKGLRKTPWYTNEFMNYKIFCDEKETNAIQKDGLFTFEGKPKTAYISQNSDKTLNNFMHKRNGYYHNGIDLVTDNSYLWKLPDIWWPLDAEGVVVAVGDDRNETFVGYGKYLIVQYGYRKVAPSTPSTAPPDYYTVKKGDTLAGIATKYNTTWQKLAEINNLTNPSLISPGQKIYLKSASASKYHTVVKGETLGGIAQKYSTTVAKLVALNNISNPNLISIGQKIYYEPGAQSVPKKTITEVAKEIWNGTGNWGTGAERKKRLEAAGYNYDAVQAEINRLYY